MLFLLLFLITGVVCQPIEIDLTGTWKVNNQNGSIGLDGTVPGQIHTDLMKANLIGDPYYRYGDVAYRWIAYDNWFEATSFISFDFHRHYQFQIGRILGRSQYHNKQ